MLVLTYEHEYERGLDVRRDDGKSRRIPLGDLDEDQVDEIATAIQHAADVTARLANDELASLRAENAALEKRLWQAAVAAMELVEMDVSSMHADWCAWPDLPCGCNARHVQEIAEAVCRALCGEK